MIEKVQFIHTDDITVVNQEQFEAHMRLYEGYVTNINKIDEELIRGNAQRDQANTTFSYYRELKRGETFALNGVILHELYFENIGGTETEPDQTSRAKLERDFGSFDQWKEDFIATAKASRGWAVLSFDQRSGRLRNISLDAHDLGNIAYSAPILVLDMYEHAYFLQYADKKVDYINNFMNNINWTVVSGRMMF
ncbi:superoxide dismutase [Lachnospiraceae bacterium MD1]|uniref:superoxide dismutase n=1 Tax=Variimorphobacter saccharofermentans TaxID=2755051 RepID=A0A839JZS9_9FIRM|nr:superoxide dismutase [Variimorphobacter saccharofermentans]MBB2182910.1 superoxide dismutase [Variimorphobacter saccharofermentans]